MDTINAEQVCWMGALKSGIFVHAVISSGHRLSTSTCAPRTGTPLIWASLTTMSPLSLSDVVSIVGL
eukprot:4084083-Amphidinium_carterae.1